MEPSLKTVKRLFAFSRNRCAYPHCDSSIVESSGTVTGVICHMKARSKGGPRYDPQQSEEERNSFSNLLLLCARHGKLIDSEPQYTVDVLLKMKEAQAVSGTVEVSQSDSRKAELLLDNYRGQYNVTAAAYANVMIDSPGGVQATSVVINNQKRRIKIDPPAGSLASDLLRRNYVSHLIDRFNEFAKSQPGRTFRHGAIYGNIKKQFGTNWSSIPLCRFDDLVSFLHRRIDGTMVGRINRGKRIVNYSTFDEYQHKYTGMKVT